MMATCSDISGAIYFLHGHPCFSGVAATCIWQERRNIKLSFPYFIHKEWLESLMDNINGKNVSSRRLQVCSFQLPKRLTGDIYATKQVCVMSYNQTSKHFLTMSKSHSIRKSCLLISGRLNRFY